MEVLEATRTKRAVRSFEDRQLPESVIQKILNAGRRAQSAKNMQPWHFIAIQNKETLKALSELGDFAGHLAGAAVGVAIITPHPDQRFSVMFDAGQAAAYMQLTAWELGVGSCLATIYQPERARELLGFPNDLHIRIAISFGYPSVESNNLLPPRKHGRRKFEEVIHFDKWQETRK